jgi:hypothetical protein
VTNANFKFIAWFVALPLVLGACATQDAQNAASSNVQTTTHALPNAIALPAPNSLELQYGIQITHIGLTASGGLVDLRFKVLDAAKAKALLGNAANPPMLIAGDMPPLMPPHKALHGAKYSQGQVVYILYPNLRSAVKPGAEVTVAMGDVRFGPVTAQ